MSFIPVITLEDRNSKNDYTKFYADSTKHKHLVEFYYPCTLIQQHHLLLSIPPT
jgi:hypothetical protein